MHYILLIALLISTSILATGETTGELAKKFKPHMAIHINEGCPSNSSCTKYIGKLRSRWAALINNPKADSLNRFAKAYGLPFRIWTTKKDDTSRISYDSRCKKHRTKDDFIYESTVFIKGPKDLIKKEDILSDYIISNGKKFFVPRGLIPYKISNNSIFVTAEDDGNYFNLEIYENYFRVKNVSSESNKEIVNSKCSKSERELFSKHIKHKNLFQGIYCKKVWNESLKKYSQIILGWSC